jgi:hypothetical protein
VTPIRPRARPRAAPLVILVVACSLLSALIPAGAAADRITPSFGSTRGGTGVPNGSVSCSELVTGATLSGLVAQYYPNASLLPSESQAEQAVNTTWNDLCGSIPFQQAVSSAGGGWFEYISLMQDKNRTASGDLVGSLFVDFDLTWNASCPSGGTGYPAGYGCQFNDAWQANLTDQSVTGPAVNITSLRLVACDTPDANETAAGSVEGFFPDAGTSPNESVAIQEVQAIWWAICSSATYYGLAASLDLPQVLSFSTWRATTGPNATLSTSGPLYFEWSLFTGDRSCPSENGSSSSGAECSYYESWTADLTQDTYAGPTVSSYPILGGPPGTPQATENGQYASGIPTILGFCAFGGVVVVAVLVDAMDRRRR